MILVIIAQLVDAPIQAKAEVESGFFFLSVCLWHLVNDIEHTIVLELLQIIEAFVFFLPKTSAVLKKVWVSKLIRLI